ncbi:MAG: N-acetyltransferase family protein [Pseudomonadota bacterium]
MIRAAEAGDDAAIAALWNTVIAAPHITFTTVPKTASDIAAQRALHPVLVAGAVDGFATFGPFRGGPGYAKCAELSVHVAEHARGKRIGFALVTALEEVASAQGLDVLVAGISGANPGAQTFFARLGYAHVGNMLGIGAKHGRRYDLVLMQKYLPSHPDFGLPER